MHLDGSNGPTRNTSAPNAISTFFFAFFLSTCVALKCPATQQAHWAHWAHWATGPILLVRTRLTLGMAVVRCDERGLLQTKHRSLSSSRTRGGAGDGPMHAGVHSSKRKAGTFDLEVQLVLCSSVPEHRQAPVSCWVVLWVSAAQFAQFTQRPHAGRPACACSV